MLKGSLQDECVVAVVNVGTASSVSLQTKLCRRYTRGFFEIMSQAYNEDQIVVCFEAKSFQHNRIYRAIENLKNRESHD
jgi:hypothetical protein